MRRSPRTAKSKRSGSGSSAVAKDDNETLGNVAVVVVAGRVVSNSGATTQEAIKAYNNSSSAAAAEPALASWDEFAAECTSWLLWARGDETKAVVVSSDNARDCTVHQLLRNRLLPFLETCRKDEAVIKEVFEQRALWQSLDSLRTIVQTETLNNGDLIRQVQLQVALRLALWTWAGEFFVQGYHLYSSMGKVGSSPKHRKKSRTKKKTKQQNASKQSSLDVLLQDIIGFLQVAALRLQPDTPFLNFVKECVTNEQSESLPQLQQIWESFEIASPFLLNDSEDAATAILALSPPPKRKPKRKEVQMTKLPTRDEHQPTVPSKPKVGLLPVTNVSLTAPIVQTKPNSLLLGSNTRFVGSHFNTRLTNVGSLFRQVAVPFAEKKNSAARVKQLRKRAKEHAAARLEARLKTTFSQEVVQNETQFTVPDTPLAATAAASFRSPKRRRVTLDSAKSVVLETPGRMLPPTQAVAVSKHHVVLETPRQQHMLPPPPKRPAGMALVRTKTKEEASSCVMPPPPSRLVAEAIRSIQRRQNRHRKSMK